MTAADAVLIPMVPGEGDVTEAARTVELVAGVASAARRYGQLLLGEHNARRLTAFPAG